MKLRVPWSVLVVAGLAFGAGRLLAHGAASSPGHAAHASDNDEPLALARDSAGLASTPGPAHARLDALVGEWEAIVTAYVPGADPVQVRGTVTREWVLDGRFVREVVDARTRLGPFRGIGYIGHNNMDGRYELVWMENRSTAISVERGTFDAGRRVLSTRGDHRDPATGRFVSTRSEVRMDEPDRHVVTSWTVDANGREVKSFEGVFERVR